MIKEWGNFHAVGSLGTRHGLIGHDSADVMRWIGTHAEFDGSIYFDHGDGGEQVEVTEQYLGCPYCGTRHDLRVASVDPRTGYRDLICEDCFTGTDTGPCFDDLPVLSEAA